MSEHIDQQTTTTTTASKSAPTVLTQDTQTVCFKWTEGLPRTAYSAGKTISLGDFQFARVGVTIEIEHSPEREGDAFSTARFLAKEIVDQEEASIKQEERSAHDFEDGGFSKYRVTIEYGLTLKTGKFDSAKVDVNMTRFAERDQFGPTISDMRKALTERVMSEASSLKG